MKAAITRLDKDFYSLGFTLDTRLRYFTVLVIKWSILFWWRRKR